MKKADKGNKTDALGNTNTKSTSLKQEKKKQATELEVAYKVIARQIEEKGKRAAELVQANIELAFQNEEKGKRAAELEIANKELIFQNDLKEKKAEELKLANRNLKKAEENLLQLNAELEEKVKKRSSQFSFISQVNQAIVLAEDIQTLFRNACSIALTIGKYKMAWIGAYDEDKKTISLIESSGIPDKDIPLFTKLPYKSNSPEESVLRTGKYFLSNNVEQTLKLKTRKQFAIKHNIRSFIVLPIKKSGNIYGTFNIYATENNFFEKEDVATLLEVSEDISFALDQFELTEKQEEAERQLQKSFAELETISNEQSTILNTLPASIALLDNKSNIVKVNSQWIQFGKENGLSENFPHVSTNYIEISEKSLGRDKKEGQQMAQGLRKILRGDLDYFSMEYPCDSPTERRWFRAEVKPFKTNVLSGAVVMHLNISERKKAENKEMKTLKALQHALNDINKIMDSSLDIICTINEEGKFVNVSSASERILGYTPKEMIGEKFIDFVLFKDVEKTKKAAEDILSGISLTLFENRYVHKKGGEVPLIWSAKWDGTDKIMYCIAKDATEKKRLQKALETERQRFYDLFTEAPSSMGILSGPNHVFVIVNPLYLQLIGKDNIIGKTVLEVLPEAADQGLIELLDNVYKTGITISASEMVMQLNVNGTGQLVDKYLNFMYQAHRTENDKIDGVLFFAVDVTEQVVLRQKIEESEAKLKEAQTLLQLSTWEINLGSNVSTWSDEFYAILGVTREEIKPSPEAFLSMIHPDDFELAKTQIEKTFETLEPGSYNARIQKKNGDIKYIYSEWKFELDTNGKPIRLYGILQDITEKIMADDEREKLVHELLQRNRALEQFTFILSHNLRAPITNVIGYTEFLQDDTLTSEEKTELMEGLASSASGLDTIIKDINSILQIKQEINDIKEIIYFSKILNDITINIRNSIEVHEVEMVSDFSEVDEIFSLKVYLHSIFYNLISNSIKYRKPNVKPRIEIKSKKENGKVILTFIDNGLGIDLKAKGDLVFGLYKRFHSHVEEKGMGLFMVKTQVEAMNGKISLKSEPNKGTEFTIVFDA